MKRGWIVWNLTNYGDGYEFFCITKSLEQALARYKKILKQRYGTCDKDEVEDIQCSTGDSIRITYFDENQWKYGYGEAKKRY